MKSNQRIQILFYLSVVFASLSACAPVYQCGDPIPEEELRGGKRLKAVVIERDELCIGLAQKSGENVDLKDQISKLDLKNSELTKQLAGVQKQYDNLFNESLLKADQYDQALKSKLQELLEKEKLLTDREKTLNDMRKRLARQDSITERLNNIIRNALLGFKSDELTVEIHNGKVYVSMSDKLLFRSGSVTVETKGKEAIKLLADVLTKNTDINILVEGHTDNVPIKTTVFQDNWDLSVGRATSIVRMLTKEYKISPERLTASGKGEFYPRMSNETSEGRAKNRRTEIILSPQLDELMQLIGES